MQGVTSENRARDSSLEDSFLTTKPVHNQEPDYSKPLLKVPDETFQRISARLQFLYGKTLAKSFIGELERILTVYYAGSVGSSSIFE